MAVCSMAADTLGQVQEATLHELVMLICQDELNYVLIAAIETAGSLTVASALHRMTMYLLEKRLREHQGRVLVVHQGNAPYVFGQ